MGVVKSPVLGSGTRDHVARVVLEDGPVTVAHVAARLGLTTQAVRRHLDALLAAGHVADHGLRPTGPRGRGRPARAYRLTDAGHAALSTTYDDLAASALRFLAAEGGEQAVERFAASRVADLELRYRPSVDAAGTAPADRATALAAALADDGYAATARPVSGAAADAGSTPHHGVQLCQGHCPVQTVAAEFPQLCDAETEVFSRLLGVHVQRLATLAGGAHVCTTHVPEHISDRPLPAPSRRAHA